ncbi:MAG: hypothetical protein KatS3mg058_0364 [Roseiflexus sp.]|nr:MAG: hypothetical protein KatS3mg058_0364 [Roseiflexus sp.]
MCSSDVAGASTCLRLRADRTPERTPALSPQDSLDHFAPRSSPARGRGAGVKVKRRIPTPGMPAMLMRALEPAAGGHPQAGAQEERPYLL